MRKYRRKTSKKIAKMKTKGSYVRVEKEKKRRQILLYSAAAQKMEHDEDDRAIFGDDLSVS